MKVASSEVVMASVHSMQETDEKTESLRAWIGSPPGERSRQTEGNRRIRDRVTIGGRGPRSQCPCASRRAEPGSEAAKTEEDEELLKKDGGKLYLIKKIIEAITGRSMKVFMPEPEGEEATAPADAPVSDGDTAQRVAEEPLGWGMEYDSREVHYESERMAFAAEGIIRTEDGREIKFAVSLEMSREFRSEETVSVRAGDAARKVDPLVINFDGSAAELTDMRFAFDLDADGTEENIPFVGPGSGFLVLDLNRDGIVNNGTELFGPGTGNGFAELAAYDEDGNHWIDENDSVYQNLSVWTKSPDGTDTLTSLQDRQVGAVYLEGIQTPFDLKNESNTLYGQVNQTGIYVEESGVVKTVQQIDLVV
jgi:hypothetical protein